MDYGKISPQAVPHITTVTQYFSVAYEDYERTLGIQILFILITLPMLVFRIYFATKHQESDKKKISDTLNNEELNDDNDLKNEAIQSEVDESKQNYNYKKEQAREKKEKKIKKLKLLERRMNYGISYFIFHVIAVNSLDSDVISFVTFFLIPLFFIPFNIFIVKKHAFLMGLFIVPTIVASLSFFLGNDKFGTYTS